MYNVLKKMRNKSVELKMKIATFLNKSTKDYCLIKK